MNADFHCVEKYWFWGNSTERLSLNIRSFGENCFHSRYFRIRSYDVFVKHILDGTICFEFEMNSIEERFCFLSEARLDRNGSEVTRRSPAIWDAQRSRSITSNHFDHFEVNFFDVGIRSNWIVDWDWRRHREFHAMIDNQRFQELFPLTIDQTSTRISPYSSCLKKCVYVRI